MTHVLLLGDPRHFRIKGGRNPYTRDRWGFKKRVDGARARGEWDRFKETLERLGARTHVVPAHPDYPGMVFPANAGFLHPKYKVAPLADKRFILSKLTAHREGERHRYVRFLGSLGLRLEEAPFAFEGEADFFPCGEFFIFTYGDIMPTGFAPRIGIPPWRYRFSHRTDARNAEFLRKLVSPVPVLPLKLTDTRYYHGDTALWACGPDRKFLFAYPPAFERDSWERLQKNFGGRLFELSREDAEAFGANSFQLETPQGPHAVLPSGVSEAMRDNLKRIDLPYTEVDVSEFFRKGGGAVKCMLCDLGLIP